MPHLGELAAEYKEKGVQIVGIVVDVLDNTGAISASQVDLAKEIVQQTGANYTHLLPSDDLIQVKLRYVSAVPETVFVDKNGDIVGDPLVGSRSKDDWKSVIDNYLEEVK
jgi:thiol-disulfide isomerase/thioredoxin